MENDNSFTHFSFDLSDKFGDNGLICVVILKKLDSDTLFIDSWFMSCRVLKRGMEDFTIDTLVKYARKNDYKKIIGEYLPTAKNNMVADHYLKLGFNKIEGSESAKFELDIQSFIAKEYYITDK